MGKTLDITGPIEANTIYSDGILCARDSVVNLPEITFMTATIKAMGDMDIPLVNALENMEMSITKVGVDKNMTRLTTPGKKNIEVRWVQDKVKTDGKTSGEGCKAFMTAIPTTLIPGAPIEVGSVTEGDITYTVTRYKLVINGEETLLVDRLAHVLKVNGKDYSRTYESLL